MRVFLFLFLLFQIQTVQSQTGEAKGTVVDQNNESVPFARIMLFTSDDEATFVAGLETDFEGKFRLTGINPGTYDVQLSDYAFGHDTLRLVGIDIHADQIRMLDSIEMKQTIDYQGGCICLPPNYQVKRNMDPFGRSVRIESEDMIRT